MFAASLIASLALRITAAFLIISYCALGKRLQTRDLIEVWQPHDREIGRPEFDAQSFNEALLQFLRQEPSYADLQNCAKEAKGGGLDLRGCWEDLEDYESRSVCGDEVFNELVNEAQILRDYVEEGNAGASGATVVPVARSFIIKSVADEAEYNLIRQAMPKIHADIKKRRQVYPDACWSTGLAPSCAVIAVRGQHWLLMRKIDIPEPLHGLTKGTEVKGATIKQFDVKGPKWATWDGKARLAADTLLDEKQMVKDPYFQKYFDHGIELEHCGARDSALMFMLDSLNLKDLKMTDYSLYGKIYSVTRPFDMSQCWCKSSPHPKFPIMLQSTSDHNLRLAIGVIDYVEQKVSNPAAILSTMRPPDEFRNFWSRMWPQYFKEGDRRFFAKNKIAGTLEAVGADPEEDFYMGDNVVALVGMKWSSTSLQRDTRGGKAIHKYIQQISVWDTGSEIKVVSGAAGMVRDISHPKKSPNDERVLYVEFIHSRGNYMKVYAHQVTKAIPKAGGPSMFDLSHF
jgi:hypothetical protein